MEGVDRVSKILILYASKKGSTKEVVMYLSNVLRRGGFGAEIAKAQDFDTNRTDFDALVMCSGIYRGKLRPELLRSVRHMIPNLRGIPVWGLALCMRTLEDGGEKYAYENYLPHNILKRLNLQEFRFFAGSLYKCEPDEMKAFAKNYDGQYLYRRGDFRDWGAIQQYGFKVAKSLADYTAKV